MQDSKTQTIRQQMIQCLETEPMSARDLSKAVHITEKDVYFHLESIAKTIRHKNKKLITIPCSCLNCGFEFKHRKTFKKPGKCPGCRNPRIARAIYRLGD